LGGQGSCRDIAGMVLMFRQEPQPPGKFSSAVRLNKWLANHSLDIRMGLPDSASFPYTAADLFSVHAA